MSALDDEFAQRAKERQQQQIEREAQSRILGGAVIGFVLATALAVVVGFFGYQYLEAKPPLDIEEAKREQYYRGLYDTCVGVMIKMLGAPLEQAQFQCYRDLSKTVAGDWYGQESPGFAWPIDNDGS